MTPVQLLGPKVIEPPVRATSIVFQKQFETPRFAFVSPEVASLRQQLRALLGNCGRLYYKVEDDESFHLWILTDKWDYDHEMTIIDRLLEFKRRHPMTLEFLIVPLEGRPMNQILPSEFAPL